MILFNKHLIMFLQASQYPANLIISGRSLSKLQESIDNLKSQYPSVNYRPLVVDLSSQDSVRAAGREVMSWKDVPKIDIVVNNAGIMNLPTLTLTSDNIEAHFATNHLGHFLLTCLIMPKVIAASKDNPKGTTRIVNVSSSSMGDGGVRFSDINFTKPQNHLPEDERHIVEAIKFSNGSFDPDKDTYVPPSAYSQSKSANVLFSVELTKRLYQTHGILSVSLHPGVIRTELGRSLTQERMERLKGWFDKGFIQLKSQQAGAATTLVAATDPGLGDFVTETGKENWGVFLSDCQIADAPHHAVGSQLAERLWKLSEELVHQEFSW